MKYMKGSIESCSFVEAELYKNANPNNVLIIDKNDGAYIVIFLSDDPVYPGQAHWQGGGK